MAPQTGFAGDLCRTYWVMAQATAESADVRLNTSTSGFWPVASGPGHWVNPASTRETFFVGRSLGEAAHSAARVSVLQAVQEHVVMGRLVAAANPAPGTLQQVRGIAHAFHAARDDDPVGAGQDTIVGANCRLHAGSTDLAHRDRTGVIRNACPARSLARRCLAEPCG